MAAKKTTLNELGEMLAHVVKHMVTKDDLAEAVEKLDDRLTAVESKIGGIHNRIDDEALKRRDLETRVRSVVPNLPPPPERVGKDLVENIVSYNSTPHICS